MNESTTYQAILQDGVLKGEQKWRVEEARKLLLQLGSERLGQPNPRTQAKLAKITDLERLEAAFRQLSTVENWQELLANASTHSAARRQSETNFCDFMRDSSTYRAIVQEGYQEGYQEGIVHGATDEARKVLLLLGINKLGHLSANTLAALASIDDLDRLEGFIKHLDKAESWHALLAETPSD